MSPVLRGQSIVCKGVPTPPNLHLTPPTWGSPPTSRNPQPPSLRYFFLFHRFHNSLRFLVFFFHFMGPCVAKFCPFFMILANVSTYYVNQCEIRNFQIFRILILRRNKIENIWGKSSSPTALNQPPQLRVPPQPSGVFSNPPNSAVFRETPTPPKRVGGGGAHYDNAYPFIFFIHCARLMLNRF